MYCTPAHPYLHSFPTRRSSDLVTGGHLGAGLGVVELTTALHHVFETPKDILIWDVGHQCYPHKILTGRRDRRSEEHTSELQSRRDLVCRLLLEKKKIIIKMTYN